jgi:hypothetical protein
LRLQQHQGCKNLKSRIISTDSTITLSTTTKGRGEGLKIMPINRPMEILAVQEIMKLLRA